VFVEDESRVRTAVSELAHDGREHHECVLRIEADVAPWQQVTGGRAHGLLESVEVVSPLVEDGRR
jgi:hypothetical protein